MAQAEVSENAALALVIEDDSQARRSTSDLLEAHGFTPLAVASADEALREIKAGPTFHFILADVNLNPSNARDKSGVKVAQIIRQANNEVPIVGYSAAFNEEDLSRDEWKVFTHHFAKGNSSAKQLRDHADGWHREAEIYRASRARWAEDELLRLRNKYKLTGSDFATLRFLVPGRSIKQGDTIETDEILQLAGYRIRLIERGSPRPLVTEGSSRTAAPLILWLRDVDGVTIAEVYGYPELYSYGSNDEEAIRNVLLLMDGYHRDLLGGPSGESHATARLRELLVSIFG